MLLIVKILLGILSGRYAFTGPYRIIIDIVNKCNLGCIMCPAHSPLISPLGNRGRKNQAWEEEYIATDEFRTLLYDAISINVKSIWICGGGEPFLHPDIFNIIKMIKSSRLECAIFTNGIHLDRAKIEALSDMRLDKIILSLHAGDVSTYQRIHPEAEETCFKRISDWLEHLSLLKKRNIQTLPKILLRSVITRYNYDKINKIITFAIQKQVDFIEFKIADFLPQGPLEKELSMDRFQREELISNLRQYRYKRRLHIHNNIGSFISTLMRRTNYTKDRNRATKSQTTKKMFCYKPWFSSIILTNGDILGCTYNNHKKLGNVNKEKFSKIWYSQAYFDFRKNLSCGPCSAAALVKPLDFIHRLWFFNK